MIFVAVGRRIPHLWSSRETRSTPHPQGASCSQLFCCRDSAICCGGARSCFGSVRYMHVALLLHRYCLRSFAHTVYKTSPSFLRALNSHKASQNSEGSVLVEVIFGANLTRPCCAHIFRLMAAKFDEQRAASSFVFVQGSEINHGCIAYRLSSSVGVVVCCLSRKLR